MHVCTSHASGGVTRGARAARTTQNHSPLPRTLLLPHIRTRTRAPARAQSSDSLGLWTLLHHAGRRGATREQPVVWCTNKPAREDPSGRKRRSAGDEGGEGDKGSPHSSKNLCVTKNSSYVPSIEALS